MSRSSEYANAVSQILQHQGGVRANAQAQSGQIWGQTIATLGQVIPQQVQQAMQQGAERKQQQRLQQIFQQHGSDLPTAINEVMKIDPVLGMDLGKRYGEAQKAAFDFQTSQWTAKKNELDFLGNLLGSAKDADGYAQALVTARMAGLEVPQGFLQYDPQKVEILNRAMLTAQQRLEADKPKPPEAFTLSEGQTRFGPDGQPIANVPKPPSDSGFTLSPGSKRYDAQGNVLAEAPPAPPGSGSRMWVYRDGQPVRVSESEIRPGDKPSDTRQQGRPVTSGSATQIAELNTSLNDLQTLSGELFPVDPRTGQPVEGAAAATGTAARIGAALPNVVTEMFGWGETAKQKQAVIDRVKQVIGKALEGGVLRKEDEYKYTKILPTIGDTPAVVRTKLQGLQQAIEMRREELLSSLADAGYDTSAFDARIGEQAPPPPPGAPRSTPKANPFR